VFACLAGKEAEGAVSRRHARCANSAGNAIDYFRGDDGMQPRANEPPDKSPSDRGPARAARERRVDLQVHSAGIVAGLLGAGTLAVLAPARCDRAHLVALALYLLGLLAMLVCSAAYHVVRPSARRELLRRFDHAAIFLLIAGTYMPFAAAHIGTRRGAIVTGLVWASALVGMIGKLAKPRRFERAAIAGYLLLGWFAYFGLEPALGALGPFATLLLVAGGLFYSIGVLAHLARRLPFQTAIWHGTVLAGAACHYVAILEGIVRGGCG
jgi:hemolysin III